VGARFPWIFADFFDFVLELGKGLSNAIGSRMVNRTYDIIIPPHSTQKHLLLALPFLVDRQCSRAIYLLHIFRAGLDGIIRVVLFVTEHIAGLSVTYKSQLDDLSRLDACDRLSD
jgi:hypothetical protein